MKKTLYIALCFYLLALTSFADNLLPNAQLQYEQCNMLLEETDTKNIKELWDNLCIFIQDESDRFSILAKEKNNFWLTIIDEDTLAFLKENYYRGEVIQIHIQGYNISPIQQLAFTWKNSYTTLDNGYTISFFNDSLLNTSEYSDLLEECSFISYNATCQNSQFWKIATQINRVIAPELFEKKVLLWSNMPQLTTEVNKIQKISQKIKNLKKNYASESQVLFTINYIWYRLDIYTHILKNRITDLQFQDFIKKNSIYYIDKKLLWDLYISQSDKYTFFYYKDKRINTLNNNTSHFEDSVVASDMQLSQDLEYLQKNIRDKYSAEYVQGTNNALILIKKKYLSNEKYLLFDSDSENLFEFYGEISSIKKWQKWWYMLLKNFNWRQLFILYDWKNIQKIIDYTQWYSIDKFELLIWKKVQIYYTLDDWSKSNEVIDISIY